MAPAASSPLPEGIYRKYKASADFFKRWLLAAGQTLGAATAKNSSNDHPLVVYARIVGAIADQPTLLTPSLLNLWPRALAACQTAITPQGVLQKATWPVVEDEAPRDLGNYYAVLALPDDYFDSDEKEDGLAGAPDVERTKTALTAAQRKRLFDEAFMEDLNAELACLIMGLEEVCGGVYAAFHEIKWGNGTLIEATVVAHVAIDSAKHVISKLQLQNHAIRTANDLVRLIHLRIPPDKLADLQFAMLINWCSRDEGPLYQYVPGSMVANFLWLSTQLHVWGMKAIPESATAQFPSRPSLGGETYDEDETPDYTDPDSNGISQFLLQQLPLMYNAYAARRNTNAKIDKRSLSTIFMTHFEDFVSTRVTSIHLVFVVACWIRSIAAIQGERFFGQTVSLSIIQRWELEKRLRASITKGSARRATGPSHQITEMLLTNLTMCDYTMQLARANPILAGSVQLDCHF